MRNIVQKQGWIHRHVTWLLLCALCFGILAPTLTHLLPKSSAGPWGEICSANRSIGPKASNAFANTTLPAPPSLAEHCPFCLLHGVTPTLPTSPQLTLFLTTTAKAVPVGIAKDVPPPRSIRRAHLSRAPPQFS